MSKAYKCDRCGSTFDSIPTANDDIVLGILSSVDQVEINYETFSWTRGVDDIYFFVMCLGCNKATNAFPLEEEAIKAWNTRKEEPNE